ncbi:hypothetical protein, partial [Massilia scottii]|uniref:hypothetical protein n=1 Tax=Massilia scottii TaxID=3057166 RepID=UPI00279694FB
MNKKLVLKTISPLLALSLASAGAVPAMPVESPALTIKTKEKRSSENDAIFYTTAKLALQLAQQIERTVVDGKIQSETRPDGSVGTYLYGHDGRFHGITYADGRALAAIYDESGNIQAILENGSGRKIVFGKNPAMITDRKHQELRNHFAIEMGISALIEQKLERSEGGGGHPGCVERSPIPCIVNAPADGVGGGGLDRKPSDEGGVGSGKEYGGPSKTFAQWSQDPPKCVTELCIPSATRMDYICTATGANKQRREKCRAGATVFYKRCSDGCYTGDRRWLDDWGRTKGSQLLIPITPSGARYGSRIADRQMLGLTLSQHYTSSQIY